MRFTGYSIAGKYILPIYIILYICTSGPPGETNEIRCSVCGRTDLKVKYLSKQVVATFFDLVNHFFFSFQALTRTTRFELLLFYNALSLY